MADAWRVRAAVLAAGTAALLLALVLAAGLARGVGDSPFGVSEAQFETAAPFALPALDGQRIVLLDHADGPVFLYFWASWCAPCRREAPLIQRLWPEFEAAGYSFIGVNILDGTQDALAFVEQYGLTFPQVRDEAGSVYLDYGVYGLPESFFLRPGLAVAQKFVGELTEAELREMLDALAANGDGAS